jgi:hypothetical protein
MKKKKYLNRPHMGIIQTRKRDPTAEGMAQAVKPVSKVQSTEFKP